MEQITTNNYSISDRSSANMINITNIENHYSYEFTEQIKELLERYVTPNNMEHRILQDGLCFVIIFDPITIELLTISSTNMISQHKKCISLSLLELWIRKFNKKLKLVVIVPYIVLMKYSSSITKAYNYFMNIVPSWHLGIDPTGIENPHNDFLDKVSKSLTTTEHKSISIRMDKLELWICDNTVDFGDTLAYGIALTKIWITKFDLTCYHLGHLPALANYPEEIANGSVSYNPSHILTESQVSNKIRSNLKKIENYEYEFREQINKLLQRCVAPNNNGALNNKEYRILQDGLCYAIIFDIIHHMPLLSIEVFGGKQIKGYKDRDKKDKNGTKRDGYQIDGDYMKTISKNLINKFALTSDHDPTTIDQLTTSLTTMISQHKQFISPSLLESWIRDKIADSVGKTLKLVIIMSYLVLMKYSSSIANPYIDLLNKVSSSHLGIDPPSTENSYDDYLDKVSKFLKISKNNIDWDKLESWIRGRIVEFGSTFAYVIIELTKIWITKFDLTYCHLGHLAAFANYPPEIAKRTNYLINIILQHSKCISWTKIESWIRDKIDEFVDKLISATVLSAPIFTSNSPKYNNGSNTYYKPDSIIKLVGFNLDPSNWPSFTRYLAIWYCFEVPNGPVRDDPSHFLTGSQVNKKIRVGLQMKPKLIIRPSGKLPKIILSGVKIKDFFLSINFQTDLIEWLQYTNNASGDIFLSSNPCDNGEGFNTNYEVYVEKTFGEYRLEILQEMGNLSTNREELSRDKTI